MSANFTKMNLSLLDFYDLPDLIPTLPPPDPSSIQQHSPQQDSIGSSQYVQSLSTLRIAHADWTSFLSTFGLCVVAYIIFLVIYRLYFHPLAAIPGPFWAKVSSWYEFYYDFVHVGKYYEKIREMHDRYGESFSCVPSGRSFSLRERERESDIWITPNKLHPKHTKAEMINLHTRRPYCADCARGGSYPRSTHVPQAICLSSSPQNQRIRAVLGRNRLRRYDIRDALAPSSLGKPQEECYSQADFLDYHRHAT